MAHRVAELIDRAEAATTNVEREAAKQECSDLILSLWQKRNFWPNGGPFTTLYPTFKRLFNPPSEYYRFFNPDAEATGLLSRLIDLHQREMKLFVTLPNVAVSPALVQVSKETLTRYIDVLSDEEKELILFVARQETEGNAGATPLAEELGPIISKTYDSLERIEQERLILLKEASIRALE